MKPIIASLALLTGLCGFASEKEAPLPRLQDNSAPLKSEILRADIDVRMDYQWLDQDGTTDDAVSGFQGKYLTLRIDGVIIPGLTYSWRQRFTKHMDGFNATDWVYLNYSVDRWNFQGGKEVVMIGGYEYDRAPMDLYGCSVFWNNIPCYAFGVAAGYGITSNDRLTFQVCKSPFATPENNNMYGYNVMWNGNHGFFQSIWSVNMMEYSEGKYINYIALGNKFTAGKFWLELDLMNRASSHQTFFFKDCSLMSELSFKPNDSWRIYGKYTYDVNHSGTATDITVMNGTELNMVGAGLEFYPLRKERTRLRVHAGAFYSWGKNANAADLMQKNTTFLTAGLTWDMNLLNIGRR